MVQAAQRWITEREYAEIHGLSAQTLRNWRFKDRRAGRAEAASGYPRYRYFGGAVRYEFEIRATETA
jgi:hypothetical protein